MAASTVNLTELRERYLRMQLAGDRRAALKFVDDTLGAGVSAAHLTTHVVAGAQREIGRLWQENRITIAQEHMATAISQLVLAQVFGQSEFRANVGKKVVIACVTGEYHDFPARLLADALDLAGYEVRFLGANVPLDALLRMLDAEQPDLLALSVTMPFNLQSLRETVRAIRQEERRRALPIAVGGHAMNEMKGGIPPLQNPAGSGLGDELGVEVVVSDGGDVVAQLDRFLGVSA